MGTGSPRRRSSCGAARLLCDCFDEHWDDRTSAQAESTMTQYPQDRRDFTRVAGDGNICSSCSLAKDFM